MKRNLQKEASALPAPQERDASAAVDHVLDVLGIREAASLISVSVEELAIAAAAVLGGICAPNPKVDTALGPRRLPPLDAMFESESGGIPDTFDFLTSGLLELQATLVRSMERFDPGTIRLITHGLRGKQWGTKALGTFAQSTISNHLGALSPPAGEDGFTLQRDMLPDAAGIRAEAVIHPRFLLVDFPPREWSAMADSCHQRQALLVQRPNMSADPDRNVPAMVSIVLKLAGGLRSDTDGCRGTDNPITIRALLAMEKEDRIGAAGAGAFRKVLLVPAGEIPEPVTRRGDPQFPAAFHEIAGWLVEERRQEGIQIIRFDADRDRIRFSAEFRDFERECRSPQDGTGFAAIGLPGALLRLFSLLLKTRRFVEIPEDMLVSAAFELSRKALARHVEAQRALVMTCKVTSGVERAFRIVEKLEASVDQGIHRLTARAIIRKFDQQKVASFRPVLDALVGLGVLDLDANHYGLGEVCVDDAEDGLRAALAAFYAAGS